MVIDSCRPDRIALMNYKPEDGVPPLMAVPRLVGAQQAHHDRVGSYPDR